MKNARACSDHGVNDSSEGVYIVPGFRSNDPGILNDLGLGEEEGGIVGMIWGNLNSGSSPRIQMLRKVVGSMAADKPEDACYGMGRRM